MHVKVVLEAFDDINVQVFEGIQVAQLASHTVY